MSVESLADLEQKAVQRREAVMGAVRQLAVQMQPANLAREATEGATAKASEAVQAVAEKAATPKGVGISVATLAAGAALVAGWQTRLFGLLPEKTAVQTPVEPESPPAPRPDPTEAVEPSLKGTLSAAAGLGAALAIGTALSKMLPVSDRERDLLEGVGDELKAQFANYAQSLIQTAPGWVNLAATVLGVLVARQQEK